MILVVTLSQPNLFHRVVVVGDNRKIDAYRLQLLMEKWNIKQMPVEADNPKTCISTIETDSRSHFYNCSARLMRLYIGIFLIRRQLQEIICNTMFGLILSIYLVTSNY